MESKYLASIQKILNDKGIPMLAVADAEVVNCHAPAGFRPEDHLPGAKSMLVFARPLPLEVFDTQKDPKLLGYKKAFFASYQLMNDTAGLVAGFLEAENFASLPLPSYSPIVFNQGEPWGKMSFKHAAEMAGLGKIGKNTLFIHPDKEFGNTLRFGGALTTLKLPAGQKTEFKKLCPPSCTHCSDACPVGALGPDGINKTRCMTNCIKNPFLPPYTVQKLFRLAGRKSKRFTRFLEWFALTFFEEYGIKCVECLRACPHFPGRTR